MQEPVDQGGGDAPEFFGDAPNIASRVQDAAAPDPWLNWNWIFWDSYVDTARILSMGGGDDDSLRPWYGYRVWADVGNLRLTVPVN